MIRAAHPRLEKNAAVCVAVALLALASPVLAEDGDRELRTIKVWVPGVERVEVGRATSGALEYAVTYKDGRHVTLSPDAFAETILAIESSRPWWQRILNISSPIGVAWVGLGLLGQILFTGRMLVQWMVSEREQRSVVPVAFWWMSLGGATMLMIYFVWRKDLVGILGQSVGWIIYARNLTFIHRRERPALIP